MIFLLENSLTVVKFKLHFFQKYFCVKSQDFKSTFQKNLTCLSPRANLQNPVCMTDPVEVDASLSKSR